MDTSGHSKLYNLGENTVKRDLVNRSRRNSESKHSGTLYSYVVAHFLEIRFWNVKRQQEFYVPLLVFIVSSSGDG